MYVLTAQRAFGKLQVAQTSRIQHNAIAVCILMHNFIDGGVLTLAYSS